MDQPRPAPLGIYGNPQTIPGGRAENRTLRHRLKAVQRLHTDSVSGRLCFLALGTKPVRVSVGPQLVAHVSGVTHCGSPWACPVCMVPVRRQRASEVEEGLGVHFGRGGSALFVTFTGAHRAGDRLRPLLSEMAGALGSTLQGRGWKARRDRLGYVGSMRAVEVLFGRNGWHPHTHAALLFDRSLVAAEVAEFRRWLFGRWAARLAAKGFGELHPVHGLDVRPVYDVRGVGDYVTKVGEGWGVGLEMTQADRKSGHGVPPLRLLRDFAGTGDLEPLGLWREYEAATFGRRFMRWSDGLRVALLGVKPELTDEEAAALEGADRMLVTVEFGGDEWSWWVLRGEVGALLRRIEEGAAVCILMAGWLGVSDAEEVARAA